MSSDMRSVTDEKIPISLNWIIQKFQKCDCSQKKLTFSQSYCRFGSCLVSQRKHGTIPIKQWCICIGKCKSQWFNVLLWTRWSWVNRCIWIAWQVFFLLLWSMKPLYSLHCQLACFCYLCNWNQTWFLVLIHSNSVNQWFVWFCSRMLD